MISTIMQTNKYYHDIVNTLEYSTMLCNVKAPLRHIITHPETARNTHSKRKTPLRRAQSMPSINEEQLEFIRNYYTYLENEAEQNKRRLGTIRRYLECPFDESRDHIFHTITVILTHNINKQVQLQINSNNIQNN